MKLMSRYYTKNKLKKKRDQKTYIIPPQSAPRYLILKMSLDSLILVSLYSLSKVASLQS